MASPRDNLPPMTQDQFTHRLGEQICDLRRDRGLTQEVIATRAKITRQHLQRLENGTTNPTVGTLFRVAKVLGVPLSELVRLSE